MSNLSKFKLLEQNSTSLIEGGDLEVEITPDGYLTVRETDPKKCILYLDATTARELYEFLYYWMNDR